MTQDAPNPFTPSFGVSPPLLAGRETYLTYIEEAIAEGPGSPFRASLFSGQRGLGKTVMLNAVETIAAERGWAVISVTARKGIAQEILATILPTLLRQHHPEATGSFVTGATAGIAGISAGLTREPVSPVQIEPSLRHWLTELSTTMAVANAGVLISIDEIGLASIDDLQIIAQTVQHAFREGQPVMLTMAGLPDDVQALLDAPSVTFLRRAERAELGPVTPSDAAQAIRDPMFHAGKLIENEALEVAVNGSKGYPFLIQLVGYHTWRAAKGTETIAREHVVQGVDTAKSRVGQLVHSPALRALSGKDRKFLEAMALDDGPSRFADLTDRLGAKKSYVSQYRRRLLRAEVIYAPARGILDFTLPYMREYIRDTAAQTDTY